MEPKGSLPHSQAPATCPYPAPDKSSPCPHFTSWRSILILSSHIRLGLPSGPRPCKMSRNIVLFTARSCWRLAQTLRWRITPCQLSAAAYSIYSQLPSISGGRFSIRNLRTRHGVVTGTHLSRIYMEWLRKSMEVIKLRAEFWNTDPLNTKQEYTQWSGTFHIVHLIALISSSHETWETESHMRAFDSMSISVRSVLYLTVFFISRELT
jgi:hypothetical protein